MINFLNLEYFLAAAEELARNEKRETADGETAALPPETEE